MSTPRRTYYLARAQSHATTDTRTKRAGARLGSVGSPRARGSLSHGSGGDLLSLFRRAGMKKPWGPARSAGSRSRVPGLIDFSPGPGASHPLAVQLYSCRRGSHLAVATLLPFSRRRLFFFFLGSSGFPLFFVCWLSCTALEGPTVRLRLASLKEARGQTGQALAPSLPLGVGEKRRRGRGGFLRGRALSRGLIAPSSC